MQMRRFAVLFASAAALALSANPAAAKLMDLRVSGGFNDHPELFSWRLDVVYRVSPDVTCTGCWENGYFFALGPSDVLKATLSIGTIDGSTVVNFQNPGLSIFREPDRFFVDFYGGAQGSVTGLGFSSGAPFTAPDAPFSFSHWGAGTYGFFSGGNLPQGEPHTEQIVLTAHVPEPATWAMLILGFGAAGALLRRRETTAAATTA
jgi:hypothetical protein